LIGDKIGNGNYGNVYKLLKKDMESWKFKFRDNGKLYVLKLIQIQTQSISKSLEEADIQRFVSELGLAPRIYETFVGPTNVAIIMDMLPITLSSKLEEGNETKKLIDDVFILIQKLHDNNIVHLDMNIQNFMIDSNGDVKIID